MATTQADNSSDCSTQIIGNESDKSVKVIDNSLSVVTVTKKVTLATKVTVPASENIICAATCLQPWLDLVEKLCSASK